MRNSLLQHCKTFVGAAALCAASGATGLQSPEGGSYQIVWIDIGEAAASDGSGGPRAGRQLFMAKDLLELSLAGTRVAQVIAEPSMTNVTIGARLCLSALAIRAVDAQGEVVAGAPLSVSVRQDHRNSLGLERTDADICLRPVATGEYPVRFSSLLPAADGSTRGAQIFLRVSHSPSYDVHSPSALDR